MPMFGPKTDSSFGDLEILHTGNDSRWDYLDLESRYKPPINDQLTIFSSDPCLISLFGKCFWFEYTGVTCDGIDAVCAARGGKPANIYNGLHYHLLQEHLRLGAYYNDYAAMWTGMSYSKAVR